MEETKNRLALSVDPLLAWYRENQRDLPWRRTNDPYKIWISEIMLQQTRVEAVRGYYERFLKAYPTVLHLAESDENAVMKLWEGLGYYSRARNLRKAAREIKEKFGGVFPHSYNDILSLPGIGFYTAGAIASIAYNQPVPAVDGNVLRVLSRLLASNQNIDEEKTKRFFFDALSAVYPKTASEFTQSLMELGATVCLPNGTPLCQVCPLRELCLSHLSGEEQCRPIRKAKHERKVQEVAVFLLKCGDLYAVEKRKDLGVLHGMYQFPCINGFLTVEDRASYLATLGGKNVTVDYETHKKHIFTHIEWHMTATVFKCAAPFGAFEWVTREEIEERIGLPSAFRTFYPF